MTITPAERFVLAALRGPASFNLDRAEWLSVSQAARNHSLAPLLYDKLKESAPAEFLAPLRDDYYLALTRNRIYFAEFHDLARAFDDAQIAFVALKGLALAFTLYASPVQRPLADIDLLIHHDQLDRAREILTARGFTPEPELLPGFRGAYQIDLSFSAAKPFPHNVELHWHLFRPRYTQVKTRMDWFWAHLEPARIENGSAQIFQPTAQLLHLAGHVALGHRLERWVWLYDIAQLIERRGTEIDWDAALRAGNEFGLMRALQVALGATRELFGTSIPDEIADRLARARVSQFERLGFAFANAPDDQARVIGDGLLELLMERRVGIWRAHLFPSDEFLRARYGKVNAGLRWRFALQRASYVFTRAPGFLWRMFGGMKKERHA